VPRSPKGARTEEAVLEAAAGVLDESGLGAVSQEVVARRAGISQSTLRHYFATKEDLVEALFRRTFAAYSTTIEAQVLEAEPDPRTRLERLVNAHLAHITRSSDSVAFEAFAYLSRAGAERGPRNEWYRWLTRKYAELIGQIHPALAAEECDARAYGVVTLSLGAWLTLGSSRPPLLEGGVRALRARLVKTAFAIVDAESSYSPNVSP
jgi:AcrR family transcriptional regulator